MSQQVRKSAPLLVTVALMAWCCWSQVSESAPLLAGMDEPELPRIERRALHPEISPLSQRDPFEQRKVEPAPEENPDAIEPVVEAPAEPVFDPRSVLSSLRLHATMVGTDYPVAMINGRVYSEGERIALQGLPELHCRLQRVRADRVVLEIEKEEFEIIYSRTSTTRQQRTREPREVLTTQGQLDVAADPVGKEDAVTKLLQLLRTAVPDLDVNLDALSDQCPLPDQ